MAKADRQQTGRQGEALALQYLSDAGYVIVETNWRCKHGEIDIIAQQGEMLVFVEVRTRHATTSEPAFESISSTKQARLIRLAYAYLEARGLEQVGWRIDVIAVALRRALPPVIEQVEDALSW